MARPTLLTDELKTRLIDNAGLMFHYKWVAKSCGISEAALWDYRKQDEDLANRLEEARAIFIKTHMRKAKPEFLLASADRDTFGETKAPPPVNNYLQLLLVGYGLPVEGKIVDQQDDAALPSASETQT